MRTSTIIIGFLIAFGLLFGFPFVFIRANTYFDLPVLDFSTFKLLGAVLIVLAILTDFYLLGLFQKFSGGTPVPVEPSKKLIAKGLYKRTRNPMYISHLVLILGEFLFFGHLALFLYLLLVALGLHLFVKLWEEPDLKKRLGTSYEQYFNKVPRWF